LLAGFVYTWLVGDDDAAPAPPETPAAVDATGDEKPAKAKKAK